MNLVVVTTVDIDNDGVSLADERNRLTWRGVTLVPQLAETIHAFGLPVTWYVRADPQLRGVYGSASFVLGEHRGLWRNLTTAGDEVGWHPHFYAVGGDGIFRPERDGERLAHALRSTHAELTSEGYRFSSVRMGEAIGGNTISHTLAELGLSVDSSAIPGRRRNDDSRSFDWTGSPNEPYWPSAADYRIPGVPSLPILEVPMTAIPVLAPYDREPVPRYASLAYLPPIFASGIERWFASAPRRANGIVLTLVLHPDELMPGLRDHPLYAFTPDALRVNLETLVELARRWDLDFRGSTMSGIAEIMPMDGAV